MEEVLLYYLFSSWLNKYNILLLLLLLLLVIIILYLDILSLHLIINEYHIISCHIQCRRTLNSVRN
jgi:hypothetical protein